MSNSYLPLILVFSAGLLMSCASGPQRTLPTELTYEVPWGALEFTASGELEQKPLITAKLQYADHIEQRIRQFREQSPGKRYPYRALLISGGGIRGNYGAGVLNGWSSTGNRPDMDVVTGVSVGALMATPVFLGEQYNEQLRQDAAMAVEILASRKAKISFFRTGSRFVGREFTELLERSITAEVLDAVAEEYKRGRRLFIGTTNLDGKRFTIWDMGLIASSTRPDRVEHYRKVLLASASVPILFPPVTFEVVTPQGVFEQVHVDGGLVNNIFLVDYLDILEEVSQRIDLQETDYRADLYVMHNGRLFDGPPPAPVKLEPMALIQRSLSTVTDKNSANGIYKLWLRAMIDEHATFHLAYISPDLQFSSTLTEVSSEEMDELYQVGFQRGQDGSAWLSQTSPDSREQLSEMMGIETLQRSFERNFLKKRRGYRKAKPGQP